MLEKVRQGAEVIVEQGDRTVAIIKPVKGPGRPIEECIAWAKAHETGATLDDDFADDDFAKDLEEIINSRQPLDTSVWDYYNSRLQRGDRWRTKGPIRRHFSGRHRSPFQA